MQESALNFIQTNKIYCIHRTRKKCGLAAVFVKNKYILAMNANSGVAKILAKI